MADPPTIAQEPGRSNITNVFCIVMSCWTRDYGKRDLGDELTAKIPPDSVCDRDPLHLLWFKLGKSLRRKRDLSTQSLDSRNRFEHIFAEIHREDIESRQRRWLISPTISPVPLDQIVLFGSGEFGQWTLKRLNRAGVEAIFFSENNRAATVGTKSLDCTQ